MLAFTANMLGVLMLYKFRIGDANVRSVLLCSPNHALGSNAIVMLAGGVFAAYIPWPDIIVAGVKVGLFIASVVKITFQARPEMRVFRANDGLNTSLSLRT